MAKVYIGDIGTTIIINVGADISEYDTLVPGLELNVKRPDASEETWVCALPDGYDGTEGIMTVTVDGTSGVDYDKSWDQTGTWSFQARITYDGGNTFLGEVFTIVVYQEWV